MISFEQRKRIKEVYEYEGFYDVDENTDLRCDIYAVFDWFKVFTPIERMIWSDIRSQQIPFLPQYQVGKYYPDFANPVMKIIVEADGKHHNEQAQRDHDKIRDEWLKSQGWIVFRIPGRDTFKEAFDIFGDQETEEFHYMDDHEKRRLFYDYFNETSEGFFRALNIVAGVSCVDEWKYDYAHQALRNRTSTGGVVPQYKAPKTLTTPMSDMVQKIYQSMSFYAQINEKYGA